MACVPAGRSQDRIHCPRSRSSSFGMGERTIGTYERRSLAVVTRGLQADGGRLTDRLQRPLRDLRISVTDRCNFRCVYCMPKEVFGRDYQFLEREKLLSFEEIARLTRLFAGLGVRTVRITGGEPLVRRSVEHLVELLAAIETPTGEPLELALTTNGSL